MSTVSERKTRVWPSGETVGWSNRPGAEIGKRENRPVAASIRQSALFPSGAAETMISFPSGSHSRPSTVCRPWESRRSGPPSAETVHKSRRPAW